MAFSIKRIERSVERAKKRIELIKERHGAMPSLTHNYHGGWDLGYWEGRLSVLEEMLDDVDSDKRSVCPIASNDGKKMRSN